MNRVDQNINKDMVDSDLIDVESMDLSDNQTWLCTVPGDSGQRVDAVAWLLSCDWPFTEDEDYQLMEGQLYNILDNILKDDNCAVPDKHKFDSRTYVKPKKRTQRPSIQNIVEIASTSSSLSPHTSLKNTIAALSPALSPILSPSINSAQNKYLTYNKYSSPLGGINPMRRMNTFNVDVNSDNSHAIKEYAMRKQSLVQYDDRQLEDLDFSLASGVSGQPSINETFSISMDTDLQHPANNLPNTSNKGPTNIMNCIESPKPSTSAYKDPLLPLSPRSSIDPMFTSMTVSILDEKDMNTSFLSQTTHPDNDSLIDSSLPPSLVSSANSSYVVSEPKENNDSNIFSSATFTHLEQSVKLLSARPRCQLFNSVTKRVPHVRNSESYTKSREEACQIDTVKVLNENTDKKESIKKTPCVAMDQTITLHYANNKYTDAEKENFKRDDTFYRDMHLSIPGDIVENTLNKTFGKQELNEIIQARQKLSMARKALPNEPLPYQADSAPTKTILLHKQSIITVPKKSVENAEKLLSRHRTSNSYKTQEVTNREAPKLNVTFKLSARKQNPMKTTVITEAVEASPTENVIDINSATSNLVSEKGSTVQQEQWGTQERAMVASSESSDATFSNSSPPDYSVPSTSSYNPDLIKISTPVISECALSTQCDFGNLDSTISPILNFPAKAEAETVFPPKCFEINKYLAPRPCADPSTKRPQESLHPMLLPGEASSTNAVPSSKNFPKESGLPKSKLRHYSSHRELNSIPGGNAPCARGAIPRALGHRNVYASNPTLYPSAFSSNAPLADKEDNPTTSRPTQRTRYLVVPDNTNLRDSSPIRPLLAGATQIRMNGPRPTSGPVQKPATVPVVEQPRPSSSNEPRMSALPRPSRLPAPRRYLSVYRQQAPGASPGHY